MKRISEKERIAWCYSFKASKRWFNTLKFQGVGSKHTLREYSRAIYTFCQWIGKNPDQLITERKQELKDTETEKNTEQKVTDFCLMLEHERNTTKTTLVTKYFAPIKSFYKHNDLPLKLRTPKHIMRRREPHSTEEIKKLMMIANVREKAIIMILKDSGMSREDVVKLTYSDIKNEIETEQQAIHIRAIRQKQAIQYDTFIGNNAIDHLKSYIDYRKRMGEQINDDSPLLATLSGKPLTPENLSLIFIRLGKKAGFKTSPHRLRKYFESHLGLSCPSMLVNYWLGHSLGVESSYFLPPIEKQRQKYAEVYKEIDVLKTAESDFDRRKQSLKDMVRFLPFSESDKTAIITAIDHATTIKELNGIVKQKKYGMGLVLAPPKKKTDDCQKLIDPQELDAHLKEGWKYISEINGKIVVEKNNH